MKLRAMFIVLFFILSTTSQAKIVIGTLIFKPPYIISPGLGFDVDLAGLLCKQLKETCKFIPVGPHQLYKELEEGKIDLAMGGIPISYELKTNFIFSLPYMVSKGQFLGLKNSNLNSIDELKNSSVGVLINVLNGEVYYEYLSSHFSKQFSTKLYNDVEDIISDLHNHTIKAAFIDSASVNYWLREGGGQFKALGKPINIGNGIAILALHKNQKLINRIDTVLKDKGEEDSYKNIYNNYFEQE